jgi:hypothetical protein
MKDMNKTHLLMMKKIFKFKQQRPEMTRQQPHYPSHLLRKNMTSSKVQSVADRGVLFEMAGGIGQLQPFSDLVAEDGMKLIVIDEEMNPSLFWMGTYDTRGVFSRRLNWMRVVMD